MKNYKKVYAALILAGGLILHGCNAVSYTHLRAHET